MDVHECSDNAQQCFDICSEISGHLKIVYNTSNSTVVFWNKSQIILYENLNFTQIASILAPEFYIHKLILSNNYLFCLDCSGNMHIAPLKFKTSAQKRIKSGFQKKENNITTCYQHDQDYSFSIKQERDSIFLCLHKVNANFELCRKVQIKFENQSLPLYKQQVNSILKSHTISDSNNENVKEILESSNVSKDSIFIVFTFDSRTVYSCLFNTKMVEEEMCLKTLYSCPSTICDIEIVETETLNVIIALKSGSVIKLPFCDNARVPKVVHLNTAIKKFLAFKDSILYTDGKTLWKSENTYSNRINLNQFVVKNTEDLVKFGDQIICVTSSNQIHLISLDDDTVYVNSLNENVFYAAEEVLKNTEYFDKVALELLRANEIGVAARKEIYHIGAMALANRQDVMKEVILYSALVYENYEDVLIENTNLSLTNEIHEYFELESLLFLVKVKVLEQRKINNMITHLLEDSKLHISFLSDGVLLKTVSVSIKEVIKDMNILTPLKIRNERSVTLQIKLVPSLPGALDVNQRIWIILSKKEIVLNSENFIKSTSSNKNIACLKDSQESLENLILQSARSLHGHLYHIFDAPRHSDVREWSFYVKLPEDYALKLSSKNSYNESLTNIRSEFLHKQMSSQNFLQSKSQLIFQIQDVKVKVQIIEDDFSGTLLKISSEDMKVGHRMKNFFSNILYGCYENYEPEKVFIPQAQYAIIEDLQRSLKACLAESTLSEEKILDIVEQFQKNVLGTLP